MLSDQQTGRYYSFKHSSADRSKTVTVVFLKEKLYTCSIRKSKKGYVVFE